jgi:uncharacterized protein
MSIITTHPHGAPAWFELATTDVATAKDFYTALFDWAVHDSPMPDGGIYTTFRRSEQAVAACFPLPRAAVDKGIPAHWDLYFRVNDCDAAATMARERGGAVDAQPFEVMEGLRIAVAADPEGASFGLFQSSINPGVGVMHEVNSVAWIELASRDIEKAGAFYRDLFGWAYSRHPQSPAPYLVIDVAGHNKGGLMQMDKHWGDMPAHWSLYFQVVDVDKALETVTAQGGQVTVPAFDAPGVGRIARFADPAGAGAYLIALSD